MPVESGFDLLDQPAIRVKNRPLFLQQHMISMPLKHSVFGRRLPAETQNIQELLEAVEKVNNKSNPCDYSALSEMLEQLTNHRPVKKLCLPCRRIHAH
jgi:hypothetical protein